MKKLIFSTLFLVTPFLSAKGYSWSAKEQSSFVHGDLQTVGAQPMVGLGVRYKKGVHSMDLSGSVLPINKFSPFIFHAKGTYLLFPMQEGLYLGAGVGALNEPESLKGISATGEASLGFQWMTSKKSHIFCEANAIAPFQEPKGAARIWPGITLGIGF